MNRAGATSTARAVDVEEHRPVPFPKYRAVQTDNWSPDGFEGAGGDVTRNNWIGDPRKPPVPQVHVGAAHFGTLGAEKRGAGGKFG
jgi:hypothetical protein